MGKNNTTKPAVVVGKTYSFVQWLPPAVEKFPRPHRFTVGERLVCAGLDLPLALVEASYSTRKSADLELSARRVNSVRYLMRLGKDLKLVLGEWYEFAAEQVGLLEDGGLKPTAAR